MKFESKTLREALAAEYVLGTLKGRAHRRFARALQQDRGLRELVSRWENHLTPLADKVVPVEPPQRVWKLIEARIQRAAPETVRAGWWDSIAWWRNLGLATSALAAILLVAIAMLRAPLVTETEMLAVLTTPDSVPRMIVERQGSGDLVVKVVQPWASMPDHSLELWVLPKDGAPRSLGVVAFDRDSRIRLANLDAKLAGGAAFALSREPKGGSPSGAPTGPVLCSGAIARVRT
jgi:anti-sigma-K factor RskA